MRDQTTTVRTRRISLSIALLAGTALGGFMASAQADGVQLASFIPVNQIAAVDLSNTLTSDAISCL